MWCTDYDLIDPSNNGKCNTKSPDHKRNRSVEILRSITLEHTNNQDQTSYNTSDIIYESQTPSTSADKMNTKQSISKSNNHKMEMGKASPYNNPSDDMYTDQESEDMYYSLQDLIDEEIYVVKQRYGYFSILFSLVQTVILILMMAQCDIAPIKINPMIGPYPDALDYWGAKNAYKILEDNEDWRLISPILLHAGIIHLFCNVSVQLDIGVFFEREWGSGVWLIIYLCSALGSSILSVVYMPNNISVGSSGAVMGLFGGKIAEVFCMFCETKITKQDRVAHAVRMEQYGAVICSVVLVLAFSFVPYVDWAAHLGGLVSGFCIGCCCFSCWVRSFICKSWWFVFGIILNILAFGFALGHMYNNVEPMKELEDICGYYKQYFDDYECNCQINNNKD